MSTFFPRATVLLLTATLFGLGCSPPGSQSPAEQSITAPNAISAHAHAERDRLPFIGQYQATESALLAPADAGAEPRCAAEGRFTLTFEIEGRASHLGQFTGTGSNCTAFPIPGPVAIEDGVFIVTTMSGDRLFGIYEGEQDAVDASGSAVFESRNTITGGTGRFTDATGVLVDRGVIDFSTGQSSATMEGWISYDASARIR